MSFELSSPGKYRFSRPGWSGVAFIVEALVLLVFLAAAVAIFIRLFSGAAAQAAEATELTRAVAAAQSTAEQFSANPEGVPQITVDDDLTVVCTVTTEALPAGTMYYAQIDVYGAAKDASALAGDAGAPPVYSLTTAVYEGRDAA